MRDYGKSEMKDMSKDYPSAKEYVSKLLKESRVSRAMTDEKLLVFEALCYRIFEQRQNPENEVTVSGFSRMGDTVMEDHTFTAQWEKDKEPAGDDEKPAVADKETEAGSKVRTGDEANAGLWVTLALITALVLAALAIKRRRQL